MTSTSWIKTSPSTWAREGFTISRYTLTKADTGGYGGAGTFYTWEAVGMTGQVHTTLTAAKAEADIEIASAVAA